MMVSSKNKETTNMYETTIFKTYRSFERFGFFECGDMPEVTWATLNELARYNRMTYLGNFSDDKYELPFAVFAIIKGNDVLQYYCVELR